VASGRGGLHRLPGRGERPCHGGAMTAGAQPAGGRRPPSVLYKAAAPPVIHSRAQHHISTQHPASAPLPSPVFACPTPSARTPASSPPPPAMALPRPATAAALALALALTAALQLHAAHAATPPQALAAGGSKRSLLQAQGRAAFLTDTIDASTVAGLDAAGRLGDYDRRRGDGRNGKAFGRKMLATAGGGAGARSAACEWGEADARLLQRCPRLHLLTPQRPVVVAGDVRDDLQATIAATDAVKQQRLEEAAGRRALALSRVAARPVVPASTLPARLRLQPCPGALDTAASSLLTHHTPCPVAPAPLQSAVSSCTRPSARTMSTATTTAGAGAASSDAGSWTSVRSLGVQPGCLAACSYCAARHCCHPCCPRYCTSSKLLALAVHPPASPLPWRSCRCCARRCARRPASHHCRHGRLQATEPGGCSRCVCPGALVMRPACWVVPASTLPAACQATPAATAFTWLRCGGLPTHCLHMAEMRRPAHSLPSHG